MDRLWNEWERVRFSSLAHNAGWVFLGQSLSIICQCVYFILLARLLGTTQYGLYAGALAMVTILSQYSPLGSPYVLLRYVSQNPENFARYWGNVLVTTFTLGGLLTSLLVWGGPHWAHAYTWTLIFCIAIGECFCSQIVTATGLLFQAFEQLRVSALLNLLVNLLRVLLAAFLLWHLHHATARQWVVAALIVSAIAAIMALTLVTRFHGKPVFSTRLLCERTGEGVLFALSGSTAGIYDDIDKAMLGHYGMNTANGIYTMAYKVVNVSMMPIIALHSATTARFFRKGTEGVQSTSVYARRLLMRTAPMGLLLALLMFLAAPIVPLLVGRGFGESVATLRWLCLLPFFRAFQWSAGNALTGAGYQRFRLGTQTVAAVFNVASNLYLIPHYGWHGAAWSSLATDGMLGAGNWAMLNWAIRNEKRKICDRA
jgi:O-antigen/teichoic acid export membrane protein